MYFLSHVFRVSFISCLIYSRSHLFFLPSLLRRILFDALSVLCLGSDCVSTLRPLRLLRPCLKSCLDSSPLSQSVVRNKDWDRQQLEEQDVYKESRHPVSNWVIRSVTYEISYIQPICWSDFCFPFDININVFIFQKNCTLIFLVGMTFSHYRTESGCDNLHDKNFTHGLMLLASGEWVVTTSHLPNVFRSLRSILHFRFSLIHACVTCT